MTLCATHGGNLLDDVLVLTIMHSVTYGKTIVLSGLLGGDGTIAGVEVGE